jgi:erythromycin esterase-like protein
MQASPSSVRASLTQRCPLPRFSDPLVRWVEAQGVALDRPLDGAAQDLQPLGQLDPLLAGADLALLGETDHFIHEKSDFRLLLCRYLMARGWRVIAEELGWSDGRRVAGFMRAGDPAALDRLSLFGWTGDLRTDRDDRPTGLLRASFDAYPTALMRAEQARFYRGLRNAAGDGPVDYFGVDIDGAPGGGYADIAALLAPWSARPSVRAFQHALARVAGESASDEAMRLTALASLASALASDVGEAAIDIAIDLAALAESLAYVDRTYGAGTYDALRPGMAYREGCMKRRFADARRLAGEAPMALMGHALHLAKDDWRLGVAPGVGPGGGRETSLGHHLVQTLGLKAVSIWLVHGAGEDSQPFPDLPRRLTYPKDTLNSRLLGLETPVLFPIAGAPSGLFDRSIGVGHMYNAVQPVILQGQVDAILYLPRVTPMRELPP